MQHAWQDRTYRYKTLEPDKQKQVIIPRLSINKAQASVSYQADQINQFSTNEKKRRGRPQDERGRGAPKGERRRVSMNDQIIMRRRKNILNSCLNRRKKQMQRINRDNRRLLEHINEQESYYQLSRRKSKSVRLPRSTSRTSMHSTSEEQRLPAAIAGTRPQNKRYCEDITIKHLSIQKTRTDLQQFRGLFIREGSRQSASEPTVPPKHDESFEANSTKRAATQMGGILHSIAEKIHKSARKGQCSFGPNRALQ